MRNRKALLALLLAGMMVFGMLAGCKSETKDPVTPDSGTDTPVTPTPDADKDTPKKDSLTVATADETPSLSPVAHNAVAGDYVNTLLFNGLVRMTPDLNPEPDLAESWDIEKDATGAETIWIFHLREGVKFHDGTVMTADDVVASLIEAREWPEVKQYTLSIKTAEAVDAKTVKITTEGPKANLLYDLAHHTNAIVPKALIDKGNDFNENPVGTGPWVFKEWKRGDQIEFDAFADYFRAEEKAAIPKLIWRIIPEGPSRTIALETGEIDFIVEVDSTDAKRIEENKDLALLRQPSVSHNWLCINNEKEPFNDINVRKAINAAINKEDVVEVALNGMGTPVNSQTPSGMLGESTGNSEGYDVEKSKEYLKTWGGDPASIKLAIICSNDTKRRSAEVILSNLLEVGITATIESMDLATYLSQTAAGDFTGFIGGYTSNEMMSFLSGVMHSKSIGSSNKTRLNDPKVDELIDRACTQLDADARAATLKEVTEYLNSLSTQIPLYQDDFLRAYNKNLKGVVLGNGGTIRYNLISW